LRLGPANPTVVAAAGARHAEHAGGPCPNCSATLTGPYCATCGQKAEDYHRSLWRLAAEALEGLTDFDGRLWNTLPRLVLKPGELTHDYLTGHRAAQVPPFRMYLVAVILALFAWGANQSATGTHYRLGAPSLAMSQAVLKARTGKANATEANLWTPRASDNAFQRWVRVHGAKAMTEPDVVFGTMERWAERFAVLMLPIAAILLSVLFVFPRGFYVFDHVVFAMHSLTFLGLLLTAVLLLGMLSGWAALLLLAAPVHLFVHMRGVYRSSIAGTLFRMALLAAGSLVAFAVLLVGLVFVGLAAVQ
jgi:hypothetical protein